jgi:O-antigen/teichoic acid export membrane protein
MGSGLITLTGQAIAALSALRIAQETMRASRRIALSQVVEQVGWPALLLLLGAAIALGVGGGTLTVGLLLGAQAAFYGAATAVLLVLIARQVSPKGQRSVDEGPRAWLATGIPLALAASLSILLNRGDILALGSAVTSEELAPYTAASRYAALLVLGLAAASAAGAAGMRDAWRTRDREELQHLIDRTAGLSIAFALPIGAALIALPELALSLYGPGYVEGASALRILAAAQIVNAITGPVALVVIICDLGKTYTAAMVGSVALLAVLLTALIPAFGTLGAAVATLVALSALNVILAVAIRRRTGLRAWATPLSMVSALRDISEMVRRR